MPASLFLFLKTGLIQTLVPQPGCPKPPRFLHVPGGFLLCSVVRSTDCGQTAQVQIQLSPC